MVPSAQLCQGPGRMPMAAGHLLPSKTHIPGRTQTFGGQRVILPLLFLWPTISTCPHFSTSAYTHPHLGSYPVHSTGAPNEEQPLPSSYEDALHDAVRHVFPYLSALHTLTIHSGDKAGTREPQRKEKASHFLSAVGKSSTHQ